MHANTDAFFSKAKRWKEEMMALRAIVQESGLLAEELKWNQPCYTFQNSNIVIISSFKEHCILGFFKGALLKDEKGLLTKPGEHTQAGRQFRFRSMQEITRNKAAIRAFIREAIRAEKAGLKVEMKKTAEFPVPAELSDKLKKDKAYRAAFEALTPGRKRSYLLYFSSAKQSATRVARIEKCRKAIFDGKGWNER